MNQRQKEGSATHLLLYELRSRPRPEKLRARTSHSRTALILARLAREGGMLAKLLTPFKMGMGGRVGSGKQYISWVAIDDAVGAIHLAMHDETIRGPLNVVSPNPVTNEVFTKTLGHVLSRPTALAIPAFAAKLAFGEMADEMLLTSQRVIPKKLSDAGYEFQQAELEGALRKYLG